MPLQDGRDCLDHRRRVRGAVGKDLRVPPRVLGLDVDADDAATRRDGRRRKRSLVPPQAPINGDARGVRCKLVERHQREQAVEFSRSAQRARLGLPCPELPDLCQRQVGGKDAVAEERAVDLAGRGFTRKLEGRIGGAREVGVVAADEGTVLGEDGVALDEVGALSIVL